MTEFGSALGAKTLLPIQLNYLAPELVKRPGSRSTKTSDIWSAAMVLLGLVKPCCRLPENPSRLSFYDSSKQVMNHVEAHFSAEDSVDAIWEHFFERALEPDPNRRAKLEELREILNFTSIERSLDLSPIEQHLILHRSKEVYELSHLNILELYYLWRLSLGRNFESDQMQDEFPPIFQIPYLMVSEKQLAETSAIKKKFYTAIDTRTKSIPLDKFKDDVIKLSGLLLDSSVSADCTARLSERRSSPTISHTNISPPKECNNNRNSTDTFTFADLDNLSTQSDIQTQVRQSSRNLPLVIKEADFAYQCERILLFKKLLADYPQSKDNLRREACIDIPPYHRPRTWALLLEINLETSKAVYESIDKTIPVATDRQISVDIPRCHQYNDLMASPQGHQKLARILKAWLNYNSSKYVYWQGLDSLAAPFLLLNFDDEAVAFASLNAFVEKYLRGFFKKDNQLLVQQYLGMFSELLFYHDATLASHLESLGFLPNLYAIPWFLTMFTHVLPLHKILHVWDRLLLGDERFPMCLGLAILNQLRSDLLEYNFNDCIVAFSDLPEIDIEKCINDATHFYCSTPDRLNKCSDMKRCS